MAYNNAIPQPADRLKDSQPQILENFSQIYNLIGVNHANFNTANAGKHNLVTMPVQAANPATTATEMALYTRTSALTGAPELAIRRASSGTITEMTAGLLAATGWCYLPSGILMKWGNTATGAFPVNLNAVGPAYATLYNVQLTTRGGGAASYAMVLSTTTAASLTVATNGAITTIYWVTLGV
jgi:hypothetical protein